MSAALSRQPLDAVQVKDVVYERLRDHIVDLSFPPGEPLREVALAELFGVSKTPIREALVRLERDGLVEIAPYRGARVREYTPQAIREIFDARGILEIECVRRAAASDDPIIVERLRKNLADTETAIARRDTGAAAWALDLFDTILFALLENELLTDIVERLTLHLKRIGGIGADLDGFALSLQFHRAIVDSIERGDAAAAVLGLRAHLDDVRFRHGAERIDGAEEAEEAAQL